MSLGQVDSGILKFIQQAPKKSFQKMGYFSQRMYAGKFYLHSHSCLIRGCVKGRIKKENLLFFQRAQEQGVRLMLDAEHTNLQASIDLIILALQKKYNRHTPFVYNTYQCYRKDTPARLQSDIELAQKHNFKIACKLVRGAYMEYERQRAVDYGYEDPICDSIQETERNYKHVRNYSRAFFSSDLSNTNISLIQTPLSNIPTPLSNIRTLLSNTDTSL
jgi:hypothetical protein